MLRHTRPFRYMPTPPPPHVLAAWEAAQISDFHDSRPGYLSDLYQDCAKSDPFSPVLKINHDMSGTVRYMISAPMTYRDKCKRVPFLIDISCRKSRVHVETFRRIVNRDDDRELPYRIDNSGSYVEGVLVGNHWFSDPGVKFNRNTYDRMMYGREPYGYQNVLGADFLDVAVPELDKYLSENLSEFQPPLNSVYVTAGPLSFPVSPSKPTVRHLKAAVKVKFESLGYGRVDEQAIIIRNLGDGSKLGDEDAIHAGGEYVFEVRRSKA